VVSADACDPKDARQADGKYSGVGRVHGDGVASTAPRSNPLPNGERAESKRISAL